MGITVNRPELVPGGSSRMGAPVMGMVGMGEKRRGGSRHFRSPLTSSDFLQLR